MWIDRTLVSCHRCLLCSARARCRTLRLRDAQLTFDAIKATREVGPDLGKALGAIGLETKNNRGLSIRGARQPPTALIVGAHAVDVENIELGGELVAQSLANLELGGLRGIVANLRRRVAGRQVGKQVREGALLARQDLEELGTWDTLLRSSRMDSQMRQRFCRMKVTHDGSSEMGYAINETCFGTLA